jgi:hypothetical protein
MSNEFDEPEPQQPQGEDTGAGADDIAQVDDGMQRRKRIVEAEVDDGASLGSGDGEAAPPPQAKGSGWGEDTQVPVTEQQLVSAEDAAIQGQQEEKQRRVRGNGAGGAAQKDRYEVDTVANMDQIADLEDEGQEDLTAKVAEAPHAHGQRVQTLDELDQAVFANYSSSGDGIDLSLLMRVLAPREKVDVAREPDTIWEYDQLFTQVSSDMQLEMDEGDDAEEEKESSGSPAEEEKTPAELVAAANASSARAAATAPAMG